MLTDRSTPVALFLFAHQDDELGVFSQIEHERLAGRRVQCVYVTDGALNTDSDRRNAESRSVLHRLGVAEEDIRFIGQQLGIGDCRLHTHLGVLAGWLQAFLGNQPPIVACYVPAWEGGHPDHDLLHAVTVRLFAARECLALLRQYPLYQGRGLPGPLFRVMKPLPENGPIERRSIPWGNRLRYLRLCLGYPSQWRTWIALFPFVCLHYVLDGAQNLQPVSLKRLEQPPHERPLYYERRSFLGWRELQAVLERI